MNKTNFFSVLIVIGVFSIPGSFAQQNGTVQVMEAVGTTKIILETIVAAGIAGGLIFGAYRFFSKKSKKPKKDEGVDESISATAFDNGVAIGKVEGGLTINQKQQTISELANDVKTKVTSYLNQITENENISQALSSEQVANKLKDLLKESEQYEKELKDEITALKVLLESKERSYLDGMQANNEEDIIRKKLGEANDFQAYRNVIYALALEKFGISNPKDQLPHISIVSDTSSRNSYYQRIVNNYQKISGCKILSVNLTGWDDKTWALNELVRKSDSSKFLLMSPFVNDGIYETIKEEYNAPLVKKKKWVYPYELDLFRRLCQIYDNLIILSDLVPNYDVQVKLYKNFKPPLRYTVFSTELDHQAVTFPAPLMMAGDLYTIPGETKRDTLVDELSKKFDDIWKNYEKIELEKGSLSTQFKNETKNLYTWLKKENLATDENIKKIQAKLRSEGGKGFKELLYYLEQIHR